MARPPALFGPGRIHLPPPAVLATLYGLLIVAGALLLKLPLATVSPLTWADSLFTATSAVTVTGLAVVDTGTRFTLFGQFVLMVLIQFGGLGLMTFAVLVLYFLGMRIGVSHRHFLREDLNQTSIEGLVRLVGLIFRVVLLCEAVGAALLALRFVPEWGLGKGLWMAVFHSVSAFNNAGFALFPDSLTRYATDPVVNAVIPALLVVGGIGFSVIADVTSHRRWREYTLHTKLMLSGTAALIVISVAGFAVLEWSNPATLGLYESPVDKLMVSWFQGLTTRTAGFNTVDFGGIHDSTALMVILLMLIGGGSTSTAGGIKVTTFVVLLLATVTFFRRRSTLNAFGRSMGMEEVLKVSALVMVSVVVVMSGIFIASISHDGDFLDLAFEVSSAFGTVGLSRGITGDLDWVGRTVMMALMFIGRIGPLTLGFFLATRTPPRIRYPESPVYLG